MTDPATLADRPPTVASVVDGVGDKPAMPSLISARDSGASVVGGSPPATAVLPSTDPVGKKKKKNKKHKKKKKSAAGTPTPASATLGFDSKFFDQMEHDNHLGLVHTIRNRCFVGKVWTIITPNSTPITKREECSMPVRIELLRACGRVIEGITNLHKNPESYVMVFWPEKKKKADDKKAPEKVAKPAEAPAASSISVESSKAAPTGDEQPRDSAAAEETAEPSDLNVIGPAEKAGWTRTPMCYVVIIGPLPANMTGPGAEEKAKQDLMWSACKGIEDLVKRRAFHPSKGLAFVAGHRLDIAFGMIPLGDARRMAGTLLPAKSIYYTHKKFKNPAEFPDTIPVMAAFFSVDAAYSKRFSNLPADAKKKKPVATAPQTSKAPQ